MEPFKLFCVFFVGQLVKNATPFNPLLTYAVRFHKITIAPNITGNYTIDQYKENQFINGHVKLESDKVPDKVIGIFYRCKQGGVNCEYFQTWIITDICPKLKEKNQIWSRWYNSFVPPAQCPFDKVNYQIKNGTYDIGLAVTLYPECTDYYWKLTQKLYAGDILLGSYTTHFSFFGYRKKIKLLPIN